MYNYNFQLFGFRFEGSGGSRATAVLSGMAMAALVIGAWFGVAALVVWSVNSMIDAGRAQFWPCFVLLGVTAGVLAGRSSN